MTFREKIKSILHHSGRKKSLPNAATAAPSPTPAAAPSATKPDPNKPPNARDPGFRKSFNLGDRPTTNGSSKTEPRDIGSPNSQNVAVNGDTKPHMYTLEKYGDDYMAVSPRTNITVPEGHEADKGLASCSPLNRDESAKGALGTLQEHKPKATVVGATKVLDGLLNPQQNSEIGTEQFTYGERKDSGFVEPVPSRDTAVSPNPKPEHPSFDLESSPPPVPLAPECQEIAAATSKQANSNYASPSAGSLDPKHNSLLVPPHTLEDGASSVYSDDSTRPTLQQIASSDYGPLVGSPGYGATSPGPLGATATEHQRRYSSLVSEELPTVELATPQPNGVLEGKEPLPVIDEKADLLTVVRRSFGDTSAAGNVSPSILPDDETNAWSQDLIANIDKIQNGGETQVTQKSAHNSIGSGINGDAIPDTATSGNSEALTDAQASAFANIITAHVQSLQPAKEEAIPASSVDQQAAAFADIVMAHVDSVKSRNQSLENPHAHPIPVLLPPSQKPIVTTTNTVPHADAEQMGDDFPDVPVVEGKSPIVTTTNTVPHLKVVPTAADGVADQPLSLSFNELIYANRDKVEYNDASLSSKVRTPGEDSVYAVTKEIPGAF